MAPAPDQLSAPGAAMYDSSTESVGDGTWDFSKNTFLLPNLVGNNFDTMRYNGMGNRFSTVHQYHTIIAAHGVLATIVFLFILPFSVMMVRFYSRRPGWAIRYHAQLNVFAGLLLLVVFILPFFAVGPKRSLTNPHHGIGVAIFVLVVVQLLFGRIVRHITKLRSLRITLHQWLGRSVALLGIVQVALGLTLYGSPKYLFVLYSLWMSFLVLLYFILNYRAGGRRELYMSGGRSEAGRTRITESEYFSDHKPDHKSRWKWLGPLAAGAGIWALLRRRKKHHDDDRSRARSRSGSYSSSTRGPEVVPSRRGSASYYEDEKYSEARSKRGGGFMKVLGGAAAAIGAGKLVSGLMNRRERQHDEEYSAVSTETPRRHRPDRPAYSEFDSEMTPDLRRGGRPDDTETSLLPPSANTAAAAAAMGAPGLRPGDRRPITPPPSHGRYARGPEPEDSDFSSYVSPSRRQQETRPNGGGGGGGGGIAEGIMAGLGMGWITKKLADRRARKEEQRLQEEDDMRSGLSGSRFTGDGHPSPTRRPSRRPPPRRPTGPPAESDLTETTDSTVEPRPQGGYNAPPAPPAHRTPSALIPGSGGRSRSESTTRRNDQPATMPAMPSDPHGVLYSEADSSVMSGRPGQRDTSQRRRAADIAAAEAAARASELAAHEDRTYRDERDRYASPQGRPVSVRLKMHDDRDRNVTLRRLTDEEAAAARNTRGRTDSESSVSTIQSPSQGRRYRRDSSQRRAEPTAERRAEADDNLTPLSPPNPAFARGKRPQKDSAYYSGGPQAGPSGGSPAAGQTMSSLASLTSPQSHGTWSEMSPSGAENKPESSAAADNRRRRRLERRRGSSTRPSGSDMFD